MAGRRRSAAVEAAEVTTAAAKVASKKPKKEEAPPDAKALFDAAVLRIRTKYGKGSLRAGDSFGPIQRFSSGFLALDLAVGAGPGGLGFPGGRISLISGEESACKTRICYGVMRSFQAKDEQVVYVDAEKDWKPDWAAANGVDVSKVLIEPSEGMERTLDILAELVRVMPSGLIVVDSIAVLTPKAEIEGSFTEWQQGLAARLSGKAFRSFQSGMNASASEFMTDGPTIVIVNQFRMNISTGAKVMPGGSAQLFAGSVIVKMRAGKKLWYVPDEKGGSEVEEHQVPSKQGGKPIEGCMCIGRTFHFDISKNKTAPPHRYGEFKFYTTDCHVADPGTGEVRIDVNQGDTNTYEQLINAATRTGVLARAGAYYKYGDRNIGQGAAAAAQTIHSEPELFDLLYDQVLERTVPPAPRK